MDRVSGSQQKAMCGCPKGGLGYLRCEPDLVVRVTSN